MADSDFFNLGAFTSFHLSQEVALSDLRVPGSPRNWTGAELAETSDNVARGLLACGFKKGDRIAILGENSAEFLIAFSAMLKARIVPVPINYRLPAEMIAYIIRDSGARAAFVDEERTNSVALPRFALYGSHEESLGGLAAHGRCDTSDKPDVGVERDSVAYILYTSGSTGKPKGVLLTHGGQSWALSRHMKAIPPGALRPLVVAPYYHMNGLYFSMVCVASANPFVLLPRFNARDYIAALRNFRCPNLSGIPSMFAMALRERDLLDGFDFSFVTSITMGSAPLSDKLLTEMKSLFPKAAITNAFGLTEAGPYIFGPHPKGLPTPPLSIGYPASGVEIRLANSTDGDSGVLLIKSPGLMGGYLNLPKETSARFQDGWYATGDIVRRDKDGFFFYVGRADDMFNCGGENVYPGEVEKLLETHPDVAQAAVVAVDDSIKGQVPFAFVVRKSGSAITVEELKAYALRQGPAHSHPRFIAFLDEMPVASSHKYDRKALSARAQEAARASDRA